MKEATVLGIPNEFWIVPSFIYERTWILFRATGAEIKFTITKDNTLSPDQRMNAKETNYAVAHFLKSPIKNIKMKFSYEW